MKRLVLVLCVVTFLLGSGLAISNPGGGFGCDDCAWWCQAQGYDDGVCSIRRPDVCYCFYI